MTTKKAPRVVDAHRRPAPRSMVIWSYRLTAKLDTDVPRSDEPDAFVEEIEIELWAHAEDRPQERVGRAKATRIFLAQHMNEELTDPLFDVFDARSQKLADLYSALFDVETEELRDGITESVEHDLLYVEAIEILPKHRGRGLGLHVLRRIIELFGEGCGAVVAEPAPIIHDDPKREREMSMKQFTADRRLAKAKLGRYWGKLGFERVGRTGYFALDTGMRPPQLSKLLAKSLR